MNAVFFGSIIVIVVSMRVVPIRAVTMVTFERQNRLQHATSPKNIQPSIGIKHIQSGKQFSFPTFSDLFNQYADQYLPVEVNVPDTASMFWQGAQMAWTGFNDYFNSDDQQMPPIDTIYF